MKNLWNKINKFYLANSLVATAIVCSIVLMFVVQFRVEALQDEMENINKELAVHEDEIRLLEIEWVYLTRPARLRSLAAKYLKNNSYVVASQIKNEKRLEAYYLASYDKVMEQELALGGSLVGMRSF